MNEMTESKTPKTISDTDAIYNIPIYQRLFEWDSEKIEQLLDDLYFSYSKSKDDLYYIGMLTSTASDNNLVDGQQRFTVMTLFGIVMKEYYPDWEKFLIVDEKKSRLHFSARPEDQKYIDSKIGIAGTQNVVVNNRMEAGLKTIQDWLSNNHVEKDSQREDFCQFVYEKTAFFISKLPEGYKDRDLNKYFEAMNSTGRNLENHEIQKIICLKGLKGNSKLSEEDATRIWNAVSQMDKPLIRKTNKEAETELHKRFDDAIQSIYSEQLNDTFNHLNDFKELPEPGKNQNANDSIKDIKASSRKPNKHISSYSYHAMLSFSEFLLHILYIQLNEPDKCRNEFFDAQKLLETFKKHTESWQADDWKDYFVNLLKYRLLFDYFVILIPNEEDSSFYLEYTDSDDEDSTEKQKLRQYQAMLYTGSASKSFYLWLAPYLCKLNEVYSNKENKPLCKELLHVLKENDNRRNRLPELKDLTYPNVPLYWFRRLDYYLWEKNLINPTDNFQIINQFRFRRGGRSVEHFYPQNASEQTNNWEHPDNIHRFGNLCLISSSFNSTQSNDSLSVKIARVENQVNRKQLESIKLYFMYKESKNGEWTESLMQKHEEEMYQLLKDSYKPTNRN